jgi:hypothetical protein
MTWSANKTAIQHRRRADRTPDLERKQNGLRERNLDKLGMKGSDTAELFFNDMRVPVDGLLGEEGHGFIMMMQQLPQERLAIAVGAQAMMERGIELTIDYVKGRDAFGKQSSTCRIRDSNLPNVSPKRGLPVHFSMNASQGTSWAGCPLPKHPWPNITSRKR